MRATLLMLGGNKGDIVNVAITVDAGFSRQPLVAEMPSSSVLARGNNEEDQQSEA